MAACCCVMKQICHFWQKPFFLNPRHLRDPTHHWPGAAGSDDGILCLCQLTVIEAAVSPADSPSLISACVSSLDLLTSPLTICSLFLSPFQLSGDVEGIFLSEPPRQQICVSGFYFQNKTNCCCKFNNSATCWQWVVQLQVCLVAAAFFDYFAWENKIIKNKTSMCHTHIQRTLNTATETQFSLWLNYLLLNGFITGHRPSCSLRAVISLCCVWIQRPSSSPCCKKGSLL